MSRKWHVIVGKLLFPPGFPLQEIASASVSVTRSSIPIPEVACRVNEGGEFCLFLPDGDFAISASAREGSFVGTRILQVTADTSITILLSSHVH